MQIEQIDKAIDANHAAVINRLHCLPETARGWQNAWNRCPDLSAREHDLFRQRGFAQIVRDRAETKAYEAEQRRARAKRVAAERLRQELRAQGFEMVA